MKFLNFCVASSNFMHLHLAKSHLLHVPQTTSWIAFLSISLENIYTWSFHQRPHDVISILIHQRLTNQKEYEITEDKSNCLMFIHIFFNMRSYQITLTFTFFIKYLTAIKMIHYFRVSEIFFILFFMNTLFSKVLFLTEAQTF